MDQSSPTPVRRSRYRAAIQMLRRGHLYAGLLMLPWVLLYGVSAFLFNHPSAFADQPTVMFGKDALRGTPLETAPNAAEIAAQVVAALQARATPGTTYTLVEPAQAKFTREYAFATVKAGDTEVSLLFEVNGSGGTVRSRATPPPLRIEEPAPFALPGKVTPRPAPKAAPKAEPLTIENPLHERVLASVPLVLERTGFPTGEATVTSVPDVSFLMNADGKRWRVTYNPQTGALSGRLPENEPAPEPVSSRQFLLRLHKAHGYPGEPNARTPMAVVVDVMAVIMVFWSCSGLLMWWQIKSTRWFGLIVLILSAVAAVWVGVGMHEMFSGR